MRFGKYAAVVAAFMGALILSGSASAQHVDIEAELDGGKWVVENESGPPAPIATAVRPGLKIFESEFGELGNPFATNDPGFEVPDGTGNSGEIVALEIENTLLKWDGAAWGSTSFDEFLTITDAISNEVDVSATAISGTNFSIIDELDGGGGLHSHVEFDIGSTSGTPMDGAYLLELSLFSVEDDLTTPVYTPSDNFLVAFHLNAGGTFGEEDFEMAIDNGLLAPVPLPAAVYLFGSAFAFMSLMGRRPRNG